MPALQPAVVRVRRHEATDGLNTITVGETLPGSTYKFESIPDGIALHKRHHGYHANGGGTMP